MNPVMLAWRMLRYRVAVMLLLFFLLGLGMQQRILEFGYPEAFAMLSLLASYIAATSVNDIADVRIDKINHANHQGRPLVTGEATVRDMILLHLVAVALTLGFAWIVGPLAVAVMLGSLLLNYLYSVRPMILSHRTHLAHLLLAVAYVGVPYTLALATTRSAWSTQDTVVISGLGFLFFGRIILKDFRDRRGDKQYGRPTFLLVHGKSTTVVVSAASVLVGDLLLVSAFPAFGAALIILQAFAIMILAMAWRLYQAPVGDKEQVAIGIGAKMGNGLLISLLGLLMLAEYDATPQAMLFFGLAMTALFIITFFLHLAAPDEVIIGYRG